MNVTEFRGVADQACRALDLWSPAAVQLVAMTACHESKLQHRRQIGGPALGLCQMEPATFYDIDQNFLAFHPELREKLLPLLWPSESFVPEAMVTNDVFAAAMCRLHYRRMRSPLPRFDDPDGMAAYWKEFYNTRLGKGTVEEFKSSYITLMVREMWAS